MPEQLVGSTNVNMMAPSMADRMREMAPLQSAAKIVGGCCVGQLATRATRSVSAVAAT